MTYCYLLSFLLDFFECDTKYKTRDLFQMNMKEKGSCFQSLYILKETSSVEGEVGNILQNLHGDEKILLNI
eukprot:UN02889